MRRTFRRSKMKLIRNYCGKQSEKPDTYMTKWKFVSVYSFDRFAGGFVEKEKLVLSIIHARRNEDVFPRLCVFFLLYYVFLKPFHSRRSENSPFFFWMRKGRFERKIVSYFLRFYYTAMFSVSGLYIKNFLGQNAIFNMLNYFINVFLDVWTNRLYQ